MEEYSMRQKDRKQTPEGWLFQVMTVSLTLAGVVALVSREWQPILGLGAPQAGFIGTVAGALVLMSARLMRR
jgi:hypothetical protein